MYLQSTIVAKQTPHLQKQLQCSFDHSYKLVQQGDSNFLAHRHIEPYLIQKHMKSSINKCFVIYNFPINGKTISQVASQQGLNLQIWQYRSNYNQIQAIDVKVQKDKNISQDATIIVQIQGMGRVTRIYVFPTSAEIENKQDAHLVRAIHQNFRLLRNMKQYLSLEVDSGTSLSLQEHLSANFSTYLYQNKIQYIQIVLWIQQHSIDWQMLQRVGQIQLPQPWLEKQEYRLKKLQIFEMKMKEQQILSSFKKQKASYTQKIWELQELVGIEPEPYNKLTIDSFRHIKQQGLSDKANQIRELQSTIQALELRLEQIEILKEEYQVKRKQQLNHQQAVIAQLKKDVNITTLNHPNGFVFSRRITQLPKNISTQLITLTPNISKQKIFLDIPKTEQHMRKSKNSFSSFKKIKDKKKKSFKSHERGVASVVKDGQKRQKINAAQLREKYESVTLEVDFEMEKRLHNMKERNRLACLELEKILNEFEFTSLM